MMDEMRRAMAAEAARRRARAAAHFRRRAPGLSAALAALAGDAWAEAAGVERVGPTQPARRKRDAAPAAEARQ